MRWRPSRSGQSPADRGSGSAWLGAALALLLAAGCAEVTPRPIVPPVAAADRAYLLPPASGFPAAIEPGLAAALDDLYRRLMTEGADAELRRQAVVLVNERPDVGPAQLLLAQIELAAGEPDAARRRLEPVVAAWPGYSGARLLYARAAELMGALPEAFDAYRQIAASLPLAAARVAELRPRALEIVSNRLIDAVARDRLDTAAAELARLEAWAPEATPTLDGARRLAAARGDAEAELAAVRELRRRAPEDRELGDRLAALEVEVGDPGVAINILQELAVERPDDPEIARRLARARFRWRLVLLPSEVQEVVRQPELTRGQLAALVYWLFPNVRYARPQSARIANDVFDHPFRDEIVRVINLDLMEVDPGLHEFAPDDPATRVEALGAILRAVAATAPDASCLGPLAGRDRLSWPVACGAAATCGLLEVEADCLPAASLSGSEAVELCRRAQQLLGA